MSVLTWLLICTGWGWITYKVGYAVGVQDGFAAICKELRGK